MHISMQCDHGIDRLLGSGISRNAVIAQLHDGVLAFFSALVFHDERLAQMLVCVMDGAR